MFKKIPIINSDIMKIFSWMDKIRDESNTWLKAKILEESEQYLDSFTLYLNDTAFCLEQNHLARAALSCASAANCLRMLGDLENSRNTYNKAAKIYEINAYSVIDKSVRESLWSLQEACEHYILGNNREKAQELSEKYISLSRKVDPFLGENDAIEFLRNIKLKFKDKSEKDTGKLKFSKTVESEITRLTTVMDAIFHNKSLKNAIPDLATEEDNGEG